MADELLRRRLADALDPGADFPTSTLLSRSVAALHREVVPRRRAHRAIAVVAAAAVVVAALGVLEFHARLLGGMHSAGAPEWSFAGFPTLGPGDAASLVVAGPSGQDASLYLSTDRGHTWHRSLSLGSHWIGGYVRFFADGSGVVLADGLHVSLDRGAHWQLVGLPGNADSYRACFSRPGDGWLLGVHKGGLGLNETLYHSTDGGRTWAPAGYTDADHGFGYTETEWDVVCWGPGSVGVTTTNTAGPPALHYSADGGRTWQVSEISSSIASPRLLLGNAVWSADGRAVLPVFTGRATSLYTSTDGGRTWLGPLEAPLPTAIAHGTPADVGVTDAPGGWWAVSGDLLALSIDGGRSWSQRHIPLPGGYRAVTADFANMERGWVIAFDSSPVRRSPPAPQSTPPPIHTVVLATDDSGAHWRRIALPRPSGSRT